ncbi:mechanosensitive ion channel family protein [Sphingomonas sp. 22R3R2A-7]|uniref:mechanosensitive ion channel family protein n=1 Tax=Sphingomonas sp. 22R3R2A-7 TaxID=3050230 RepID=UPI003FA7B7E6
MLGALSVGIGFGLQAITQNFVSGLILLAERPVKIGDWVRIGNQEGDVKRINVRSTEIQVADRSTLIVPNSELITKTIQNMTLAAPIGRIQLQFSVPLESDIDAVRTMLFAAFAEKPEVLDDPEVKVFIDLDRCGPRQAQLLCLCREPARHLSGAQRPAVHAVAPVPRGGDRPRHDDDEDGADRGAAGVRRAVGRAVRARAARRA